jgi:hypothetical protein
MMLLLLLIGRISIIKKKKSEIGFNYFRRALKVSIPPSALIPMHPQ